MEKKIRIMIAKVGCDIHERGALTMMHAFREAGAEVIYTGRFNTEEKIVNAAVAEDVDILSISDLSGSFPIICGKVMETQKKLGVDIPVVCGGLMTAADIEEMKTLGVKACFGTGYSIEDSVKETLAVLA